MDREFVKRGVRFKVRPTSSTDSQMLSNLMQEQLAIDPKWPPGYARKGDLADWLGAAATKGRWVAIDTENTIVGHVGLGSVKPGACRDALVAALGCEPDDLAEICRIVIHPQLRGFGLSNELSRAALRAAIEQHYFPVSNVLSNRGAWLDARLKWGWREVTRVKSTVSDSYIVALLPPQKFIDAVIASR